MDNLEVVEGAESTHHYHLMETKLDGSHQAVSICGNKRIMPTGIPIDAWGYVGHLRERWCDKCAEKLKDLSL